MSSVARAGTDDAGLGVGDRLPPLVLPRAADGVSVAWRAPQRGAPVVVFVSPAGAARDYVAGLAGAEPELRVWNGRLIAVLPVGADTAFLPAEAAAGVTVLSDPEGEAHRRCGVGEREAALFIADRWGQIYLAERAPDESRLPGVDQIEEWLRYLATQCPECGVPDEPGRGEWEG
ncbi:MAG TPA: hypothetical protein VF158_00585 [Longimicrobiales bacterium]